jgi:hypothetical protein
VSCYTRLPAADVRRPDNPLIKGSAGHESGRVSL